jgi:hypothetical protein
MHYALDDSNDVLNFCKAAPPWLTHKHQPVHLVLLLNHPHPC